MISTIEEIIEDAKRGKMFVLVDDESRENEGDLIIPAQFVTPESINFMAKYGRGLICMPITQKQADKMNLSPMAKNNAAKYGTAFTISIGARDGVTTGISAHDRAKTVQVAISESASEGDVVSPGHMFPLIAKDGGVLVRAGHTEAAVDISMLAGLHPSAVICEVMNDDGTMARLPDLLKFAELHDLKVGTIKNLISYRNKRETVIKLIEKRHDGKFEIRTYRDIKTGLIHHAILCGEQNNNVRVQTFNPSDLLLNKQSIVEKLQQKYQNFALILISKPNEIEDTSGDRIKEYGTGAAILLDLGLKEINLITQAKGKHLVALEGFGIKIMQEILFSIDECNGE